jgi:hypothetical protein
MEQNKVRTYFFYAIGEILLVVIVILIALQVNNWNEERKVNQERIALINALKTDHVSALIVVEEQVAKSENRTNILKKLLSYSAGEAINISDDSLKVMLQESFRFEFFQNFSTTYEQAKSSGKLSLIRNENLLKVLSKNEENIEGLASVEIPVFKESFSTFNANIEIISMFDRLGNFDWTPAKHPEISLNGIELHEFIRSPVTYAKLHQIYFLNNLMYLWWGSTKYSTDLVLNELNVSLNQ